MDAHEATRLETVRAAGLAAGGQIALTIAHHLYGAVLYDAPFRIHVVFVALPVAAGVGLALYLGWRARERLIGRVLLRLAAAAIAILLAVMIGVYEGGYNHLLKNILYCGAISDTWFARLFPPPLYEKPDSWLFEISGVLQFPVGLLAGKHAWRVWREARGSR